MEKITYLFGAGASAHTLPIVEGIPDRIEKLIIKLESSDLALDNDLIFDDGLPNRKSKRGYQIELISSLKWMLIESRGYSSIDTFAKSLYLQRRFEDLNKLKIDMSIFFVFEQAWNKTDYRYNAFFASIQRTSLSFPDNVRILSWNYDYQFELAFSEFSGYQSIHANQRCLGVYSKNGSHASDNKFGIFKINGTTGFISKDRHPFDFYEIKKDLLDISIVEQVTKSFVAITYLDHLSPLISFAWEDEGLDENESIVGKAIENTHDSNSLVVIGYSFPYFNREIDKKIIGKMHYLKKIYFQAPNADEIKEHFFAIGVDTVGVELICINDSKQFFLPAEI